MRLPVVDAGIPAAVLPADPHLVWNAFWQLALEFHRAQVGQFDVPAAIVLDGRNAGGGQEGAGAGTVLLEAGPSITTTVQGGMFGGA